MATANQQLRQSFLITGLGLAAAVVVIAALLGADAVTGYLERQATAESVADAQRGAGLVAEYFRERRREVEALAASPAAIQAAQQAAQDAARRNLPKNDAATLERMFARTHELGGAPDLAAYLASYLGHSDLTAILVTETHGYAVTGAPRASTFLQSGASWWPRAMAQGTALGAPAIDSARGTAVLTYAAAIRPLGATGRPAGVLEARFPLDRLAGLLATSGAERESYFQVVDSTGRLLVARTASRLLRSLTPAELGLAPLGPKPAAATVPAPDGAELVVSAPAGPGLWIVYRQPVTQAFAEAASARRAIWIAAPLVLLLVAGGLWWLAAWLQRRVTRPLRAAGAIAGRVASGDLSVTVSAQRAQTAEVDELLASVQSMVVALRRLVGAIRSAADEAAAMAEEISASTEEMSASTEEMSATTQDLSKRAAEQAQLVRQAADDAAKILDIATTLAGGAGESARRNAELSALAQRHKETLDRSTAQLALLAAETEKGAKEAEALVQASAEIQKFVTQAKTVATQTNTLALNAAIEAARAGPQGRGFAVVADEVRKLAAQAAAAAGETADTVRGVLTRVQATRERLFALARGGAAAREAAESAAAGLARVAADADANDAWSREIAAAAAEAKRLVEEIATRLSTLAAGTENLLSATEEIAASSEQQNASTQEIASSANQLATAAESLTGAVKSFRLVADEERRPEAAD